MSNEKQILLPVRDGEKTIYDIRIDKSFDGLAEAVNSIENKGKRILIVSDSNVFPLYGEAVTNILSECFDVVASYVIPSGEENKTLDQVRNIYEALIKSGLDRHDMIAALGGGVTGDMAGFTAATYLRGIRFIQIPTTLLAQVDSSIGGKTGVDFDGYKNMVGAFHQPSLVYTNVETLKTLPDDQFASGMGEVLKHGLIRDAEYYEWLLDHMEEIEARDSLCLMKVVEGSNLVKRAVVEKDPTEKGERAILNFGHTIGHAIETGKQFELLHGECVALGCIAAAYISWSRGNIDFNDYYEIRDMSVAFGLPMSFDSLPTDKVLEALKKDKKRDGDHIRFILLDKIGKAVIVNDVTNEELTNAINSLNADTWGNDD